MAKMYGFAIRLHHGKDTNDDGLIPEAYRSLQLAVPGSVIDIKFNREAQPAIKPRVRMRSEPNRLMFDLIVDEAGEEEALQWRVSNFSEMQLRQNLEVGIDQIVKLWLKREHDKVVMVDQSGVRTSA